MMLYNIPAKVHRNSLVRLILGKYFTFVSMTSGISGQPIKIAGIWFWLE